MIDCTPCVLPKEKELYEGKCASAVKSQARYLSPILDYNPEWHDAFQRDASTQDSVNRRPLDPYFYLDYSEYLNSAVINVLVEIQNSIMMQIVLDSDS